MLSFATPATKDSPAGTYAITPSGLTSGNYLISWVDGVLTVNRPTDAYVSALGAITALIAAPSALPITTAAGFTGIGSTNPTGSSSAPNNPAGTGAPVITQVSGLPLTLTGAGINTGGHSVIGAAEQE